MTLNGAAMHAQVIKHLNPYILLIEEAGEVLENLIVPLLFPLLKQIILIGDHKQLRPQVNNYFLEKKYNLNISLLERLINNNIEHVQLKYQRRMRFEFADFIRLIYPRESYEDHQTIQVYPNVLGMPQNMIFINHKELESCIQENKSKKNFYEANYAIELAKYIVLQGQFKPNQITILCFYLGQTQEIRKIVRKNHNKQLNGITIVSVDNYQGEENEIIILSCIRSNKEGKMGFTKTENRINVAFSRAKIGFYILGNFGMFNTNYENNNKETLWQKILTLAKKKEFIKDEINFVCKQHNQGTLVKHYDDFVKMPLGGCKKFCKLVRKCGHICPLNCHNNPCESFECQQKCLKVYECGHSCQLKCFSNCNPLCQQYVHKTLNCGHIKNEVCSKNINSIQCQEIVPEKQFQIVNMKYRINVIKINYNYNVQYNSKLNQEIVNIYIQQPVIQKNNTIAFIPLIWNIPQIQIVRSLYLKNLNAICILNQQIVIQILQNKYVMNQLRKHQCVEFINKI
ncbi:nfx1-type zinc finger protein, putative [Ichthyophthirius multifiliis]|uniref:Nfx1-type zinc finger protein, putative n=1 Tax=Ichthyophthirius multifiliis TaxID=5932 RepID=G0QW36_ICHMU|nr:nfx1-type zinc finger protein, putative [Ichthyophthirius multifiliis]EGR30573.1 nfx1-type zinc finger protein, putative [Ichthyophthirius multifiliis]|eukprot:XP_004032160.1 nfx1-type zinc finger protein, putative [Ichthyophthirius multifiliis]